MKIDLSLLIEQGIYTIDEYIKITKKDEIYNLIINLIFVNIFVVYFFYLKKTLLDYIYYKNKIIKFINILSKININYKI